jgi:hypothetical protein
MTGRLEAGGVSARRKPGVRSEEAGTDELTNDFLRGDMVAFGAGRVALESCASMFTKEFEQLEVALLAEIELLSGLGGPEPLALAFNKHSQTGDDEVIGKNGELSGGADDAFCRHVELHGVVLRANAGGIDAVLVIDTLEA